MIDVRGTPVNINGRTGGSPGPAPSAGAMRVAIPVPPGRQLPSTAIAPATTFARFLRLTNLDASNGLQVGFLDGTYITIQPDTSQEFAGNIPFFTVQSSSALSTVQWEGYAVVAS